MDRVKSKHSLNAEENTERSGPRSVSPGNAVLVIAAIGWICLSIGHPSGASLVLTPQGGCWSPSTVPTSRPPGVGGGRRLAGTVPAGGTPAPGRGAHRFLPPPCAELGDSVAAAAGRLGAQASSQGAVRWHQGWLRGEREPRHWAARPRAAASGTHGRSGGSGVGEKLAVTAPRCHDPGPVRPTYYEDPGGSGRKALRATAPTAPAQRDALSRGCHVLFGPTLRQAAVTSKAVFTSLTSVFLWLGLKPAGTFYPGISQRSSAHRGRVPCGRPLGLDAPTATGSRGAPGRPRGREDGAWVGTG